MAEKEHGRKDQLGGSDRSPGEMKMMKTWVRMMTVQGWHRGIFE